MKRPVVTDSLFDYVPIPKTWSTTDMAGGGPGLPRRPATDVRSALSPRSDMQVDYRKVIFLPTNFILGIFVHF